LRSRSARTRLWVRGGANERLATIIGTASGGMPTCAHMDHRVRRRASNSRRRRIMAIRLGAQRGKSRARGNQCVYKGLSSIFGASRHRGQYQFLAAERASAATGSQSSSAPVTAALCAIRDRLSILELAAKGVVVRTRAPNPRSEPAHYRQVTERRRCCPATAACGSLVAILPEGVTHPNQNQPAAHRDAAWR
jgi:hypothetical protein